MAQNTITRICLYCGDEFHFYERSRNPGRYCSISCGLRGRPQRDTTERFLAKIDQRGDACHEWIAFKNPNGYGMFRIGKMTELAHRVAWELANGPIPIDACVCHHCDNPGCCNVQHLWLGTISENNADREAKGRNRPPKGEKHGRAKLTEAAVSAIRVDPRGIDKLAIEYGVNRSTIAFVRQGKTWKHVP